MQPTRCLLKRSVWKGPHIVPLPIVRPEPGKKVAPIRTQARSATILPNFVGLKFQIHNGKVYHEVTITEEMDKEAIHLEQTVDDLNDRGTRSLEFGIGLLLGGGGESTRRRWPTVAAALD
ncbi:hypothetical protein VTJ04DRAFT_8433 [Mycothermus thermophilus]|uniref:uncharacterized protein n=1 Tax=Humicola insolens TaxID=85995 RepID=UPI0037438F8C